MKRAARSLVLALAAALWVGAASSAAAAPITALYFTSSPASFVGQGQTFFGSLAQGFVFTPVAQPNNVVEVIVKNFTNAPPPPPTLPVVWILELQAPNGVPLTVGHYGGAERVPFQPPGAPGLDFSGNGRGNNTLSGFFDVLDIALDASGTPLRLAVDFHVTSDLLVGSLRFNSEVPLTVPEAGVSWLALGAAVLALRAR